mgnify:CR=1 FL=1
MSKKKPAKAAPIGLTSLGSLALSPGDELELADGTLTTYIGQLAGGHAYRDQGADRFTWHDDSVQARLIRSPNRERAQVAAVDVGEQVDPLLR